MDMDNIETNKYNETKQSKNICSINPIATWWGEIKFTNEWERLGFPKNVDRESLEYCLTVGIIFEFSSNRCIKKGSKAIAFVGNKPLFCNLQLRPNYGESYYEDWESAGDYPHGYGINGNY